MIKKLKKRKIKHNSKVTIINCLRCCKAFRSMRNDAKFCSALCRVQERNFRVENGLEYWVFTGSGQNLKSFLLKHNELRFNFGFSEDYDDIKCFAEQNDMSKSWKFHSSGFVVYYSPSNKKSPYEMYFNQQKYDKLKSYINIQNINKTPLRLKPTL